MANLPNCPKCGDEYTYEDGHMFICPMCGNEWTAADAQAAAEAGIIRDANGNELDDGDTVVVVKDLKVKGAGVLKQGTRVKIFASSPMQATVTISIVKLMASVRWH